MQIFGAAPQQWRRKQHPPEEVAAFRERMAVAGVGPNFIHGIYLTNLATADAEHLAKGVASLRADMQLAGELGVAGVIFHVGSHKGAGFEAVLPQVARAMREVLAEAPPEVWLCIENNAGGGDSIGSSFAEIGAIRDAVGDDRVQVCLDTCHAHSAGYDLTDAAALAAALAEFDRLIGLDHLVAVHANDSKTPAGSARDPPREHRLGHDRPGRVSQPPGPGGAASRHLAAGGARLRGRGPGRAERAAAQGAARWWIAATDSAPAGRRRQEVGQEDRVEAGGDEAERSEEAASAENGCCREGSRPKGGRAESGGEGAGDERRGQEGRCEEGREAPALEPCPALIPGPRQPAAPPGRGAPESALPDWGSQSGRSR